MSFRKENTENIHTYVADRIGELRGQQAEALRIAGEMAVKQQTTNHKYLNQTGNLSSSVGYTVIFDGRALFNGGFEITKEGDEGAKEGREFLDELAAQNQTGLVLIIVAGMNYAKYVEDMGLDVLSTAELTATDLVPKLLAEL